MVEGSIPHQSGIEKKNLIDLGSQVHPVLNWYEENCHGKVKAAGLLPILPYEYRLSIHGNEMADLVAK